MIADACIFHGTGANADSFWQPWLRAELQKAGLSVWCPSLPNTDRADLDEWSAYVMASHKIPEDSLLIGHSAGCPLTLRLLSRPDVRARRAILVAGFGRLLPGMEKERPDYLDGIDWERIQQNCREFYFLNSDNDPWGCDHAQGAFLREKLGGTLIAVTGEGHFGSNVFKQPYPEFPLLRALCLL